MKRLVGKHPRAIRWFHWINVPLLALMIWSGMLIYWANDVYRIGFGNWTLFHFFPDRVYIALNWGKRLSEGVLTGSLALAALAYFAFPMFRDPIVLAALAFMMGLGLGCGQPLTITLAYNYSPPGRAGEALGLRLTVNKFTQIVVPVLFGSLGAWTGLYPVFWSSAALLGAGSVLNARRHKTRAADSGKLP